MLKSLSLLVYSSQGKKSVYARIDGDGISQCQFREYQVGTRTSKSLISSGIGLYCPKRCPLNSIYQSNYSRSFDQ